MSGLDRQWLASQAIAVFMVVFGAAVCAGGCMYGTSWEAMKTLGASIAGAGIQSIVSALRQQSTKHDPTELPPGGEQTDTTTIKVPPITTPEPTPVQP